MNNENFLFILTGKYLFAEVYKSSEKIIIEVKDDLDESLVEKIYVNDEKEALIVAYNATVGKG